MLNVTIIVVALLLAAFLAFSKRLSASPNWKATVTPLASIMGSGFLVSAPLLGGIVGNLAVVCMAMLLVLAFAVVAQFALTFGISSQLKMQDMGPRRRLHFFLASCWPGRILFQ